MSNREIELKFEVTGSGFSADQLRSLTGGEDSPQEVRQVDTYYSHPCRDFKSTGEALRIRRVNERSFVTYKGPKSKQAGGSETEPLRAAAKVRKELEWWLGDGDPDGAHMEDLLRSLGFEEVAQVRKLRTEHRVEFEGRDLSVAYDQVDGVGAFVEVEAVVGPHESSENAVDAICRLADRLNLRMAETKSYLQMVLERSEKIDGGLGD